MKPHRVIRVLAPYVVSAMAAIAAAPATAQATSYPQKTVTVIVPFGPGSLTDILARTVSNKLSESFNQPFVVENRPGADGNIGTAQAAAAQPDGYTLLVGAASTNAINPSLHDNLKVDPEKAFVPITSLATVNNVLVVGPQVSARNVKDLIETLKKSDYNYASSGAGGSMHLSGELFKSMTKTNIQHIAYKGSPAAVNDVLGGRVELMFCNMPVCLPHIKAGKLSALAVTSSKRSPLLPNLPTIAESGLPGYDVEGWFGMFAPTGTPPEIVKKLNTEVLRILRDPKVKEQLSAQGAEPAGASPEEFAAFVKQERQRWARVIKEANIRLN